jgi:hypothetical protein
MPNVRFLPVLAGLSLLGCERSSPTLVDGEFSAILVYGQVRTAAGEAVPGAAVSVWHSRSATCDTNSPEEVATSDAGGAFRAVPGNWGRAFDACIVVRVQPPAASGLSASTISRHPVRLSPSVLDSVRMDVVLQE